MDVLFMMYYWRCIIYDVLHRQSPITHNTSKDASIIMP